MDKAREICSVFSESNSTKTCCRKDSTGLVESSERLIVSCLMAVGNKAYSKDMVDSSERL